MNTKQIQITTHSVEGTQKLGQDIGARINAPTLMALTGGLGSGKTVFVQGLAQGLEVPANYYITSPTFTLINEYPGRYPLFHVDLYRIDNFTELEEIGLDEILYNDGVVAIEWADRLSKDILLEHIAVNFEILDDESRKINIFAYGHTVINLIKALPEPAKKIKCQ